MGIHHIYDNLSVQEARVLIEEIEDDISCTLFEFGQANDNLSVQEERALIEEIEEHISGILFESRQINDRNKSRFERKVNGDDNVSDYESIEEWEELSDYFDYELEESEAQISEAQSSEAQSSEAQSSEAQSSEVQSNETSDKVSEASNEANK